MLLTVIIIFLGKRTIELVTYQDPATSTHIIFENRANMENAINFGEYDVGFFLLFLDDTLQLA